MSVLIGNYLHLMNTFQDLEYFVLVLTVLYT